MPFMPYGFQAHVDGTETRGVMAAAAIIFFAFYGFDAVSTAAEETGNPGRDLVRGIVGSMVVCTVIYIAVAGGGAGLVAVSGVCFQRGAVGACACGTLDSPVAANLIAAAAIVALPTVILGVSVWAESHLLCDGAGWVVAGAAGEGECADGGACDDDPWLLRLSFRLLRASFRFLRSLSLPMLGRLLAFVAVAGCVMALRVLQPARPRVFRMPLVWVVGPLAVVGCIYLFFSLPEVTRDQVLYLECDWAGCLLCVCDAWQHIGKRLRG